jgi:hypothetical protein
MSKIKYCSLDEAWGSTLNPQKNEVHSNNNNKELTDNPLRTPNLNYECKNNIPKVENDYYINTRPKKQYNEMYYNMDSESQDLYSFIDTLHLTERKRKLLLDKIKNVFNMSKDNTPSPQLNYSNNPNNSLNHNALNHSELNSQENFQNPYYNLRNDNKPTDILFLILLGVFLIFIMDKK